MRSMLSPNGSVKSGKIQTRKNRILSPKQDGKKKPKTKKGKIASKLPINPNQFELKGDAVHIDLESILSKDQ
jgi:hypothetical protein